MCCIGPDLFISSPGSHLCVQGISGLGFLLAFVPQVKRDGGWEEVGVPFTRGAAPQGVRTEQPAAQPELRRCQC